MRIWAGSSSRHPKRADRFAAIWAAFFAALFAAIFVDIEKSYLT